jgi:hypothetical protein
MINTRVHSITSYNADEVSDMFTVRKYLRNRRGRCLERLSNPNIRADSVVHVSATEATALSQGTLTPVFGRFIGAADIWVKNVSPSDGRVDFIVQVDWNTPLNIVMDISIFDPVPFANTVVGT